MPEILTLGEPLIEFNQTAPQRPQYLQGFGGDVSNTAIAAARFGARAGIITRIGSDQFGDLLLDLWQHEGVDTHCVQRDPHAPTGLYFVTHNAQGHHFSYRRQGSAASLITPDQLPIPAIQSARWLHVSAISQAISSSSLDTVNAAITAAKQCAIQVCYDPNLRLALWPLERARATIQATAARVDLFLPSYDDVVQLSGASNPEQAMDWCLAAGARKVVLKLGGRGVMASLDGQLTMIAPHRIDAVDGTGAGDCFAGVLLACLCAGETMMSAIRYANAAAAIATTGFGAVAPLPTRVQVEALLEVRAVEPSHVS
jgi:2-dehydro-3-deoxygluconokinase